MGVATCRQSLRLQSPPGALPGALPRVAPATCPTDPQLSLLFPEALLWMTMW